MSENFFDPSAQSCFFFALQSALNDDCDLNDDCKLSNEDRIVHYTDSDVLDALLSKGILWATNIFYLNDNLEYKAGIRVLQAAFKNNPIKKYVDELENDNGFNWPGVFSMSFTTKSDELQQWITYAKESGISIEFDAGIMQKKMWYHQECIDNNKSSKYYYTENKRLYKIAYIDPQNTGEMNKKIENIKSAFIQAAENKDCKCTLKCENCECTCWLSNSYYAKGFMRLLATYYKSASFHGEKEIRASFLPATIDAGMAEAWNKILYIRKTNGMLRPYIEVLFAKAAYKKKPCPAVPIKAITVGPSGIQDKLYSSVVHRLKYGNTDAVWLDGDDLLMERMKDYLNELCKKTKNSKKEVAEYILGKWNEENGKKFGLEYTNKGDIKIVNGPAVSANDRDKDVAEEANGQDKDVAEEANGRDKAVAEEAEELYKFNYFSRHGIWVKKSKIEYIF